MNNIYVHIDAVLDTRTTIWRKILTDEQFIKLLDTGYYDRYTDIVDTVAFDEFSIAYKNRTNEDLLNSYSTNIVDILTASYTECYERFEQSPITKEPIVFIDMGHYKLEEDCITSIVSNLVADFPIDSPRVYVINDGRGLELKDLSKMELAIVYLYDFETWLDQQVTPTNFTLENGSALTNIVSPLLQSTKDKLSLKEVQQAVDELAIHLKPMFKWMPIQAKHFTTIALSKEVVQQVRQSSGEKTMSSS